MIIKEITCFKKGKVVLIKLQKTKKINILSYFYLKENKSEINKVSKKNKG